MPCQSHKLTDKHHMPWLLALLFSWTLEQGVSSWGVCVLGGGDHRGVLRRGESWACTTLPSFIQTNTPTLAAYQQLI